MSTGGLDTSARTANIGWLGLQLILSAGGAGYFPERMARGLIDQGRLWAMEESPLIRLPAYMVYPLDREEAALLRGVETLRRMGAEEQGQG
jgi:LysR family transcriptional regulator, flagellar master operon regulator